MRRDGSIVWARVAINGIRDSKGVLRWCAAVLEDITEKLRVEQQLSLAQQVSGLATWNFAVDANSSETSRAYNKVFGLADAEPAPSLSDLIERVHPDDRRRVSITIQRAIATGIGYMHKYRIVHPNGDVRWLRGIAKCTLDASGKVTNLIGATIDITDSRNEILQSTPRQISLMLDHIQRNWNKQLSVADLAKQVSYIRDKSIDILQQKEFQQQLTLKICDCVTHTRNLVSPTVARRLSVLHLLAAFRTPATLLVNTRLSFASYHRNTKVGRALCLD